MKLKLNRENMCDHKTTFTEAEGHIKHNRMNKKKTELSRWLFLDETKNEGPRKMKKNTATSFVEENHIGTVKGDDNGKWKERKRKKKRK